MANNNQLRGVVLAAAIKRLKAAGLSAEVLGKATAAVRGEEYTGEEGMKLPKSTRKKILALTAVYGPLVFTGTKGLKMYTLQNFKRIQANSSANAKKHQPWKKAAAAAHKITGKISSKEAELSSVA